MIAGECMSASDTNAAIPMFAETPFSAFHCSHVIVIGGVGESPRNNHPAIHHTTSTL
jgi:hypothetical protein